MASSQRANADKQEDQPQQLLMGHTAAVLCLTSMGDCFVASGSEDGTVRIWDSSTRETRLLIHCEGEVQAIALCPLSAAFDTINDQDAKDCRTKNEHDDDTAESPKSSATRSIAFPDEMLLFACDNTLYACDLSGVSLPAETNGPVILSVNTLPTLWQTTDEINQISWTRAPAPATTLAYTTTKGS
eukprot:scaffold583_cov176-Amphora_coffeaeformis.AAC.12